MEANSLQLTGPYACLNDDQAELVVHSPARDHVSEADERTALTNLPAYMRHAETDSRDRTNMLPLSISLPDLASHTLLWFSNQEVYLEGKQPGVESAQ